MPHARTKPKLQVCAIRCSKKRKWKLVSRQLRHWPLMGPIMMVPKPLFRTFRHQQIPVPQSRYIVTNSSGAAPLVFAGLRTIQAEAGANPSKGTFPSWWRLLGAASVLPSSPAATGMRCLEGPGERGKRAGQIKCSFWRLGGVWSTDQSDMCHQSSVGGFLKQEACIG